MMEEVDQNRDGYIDLKEFGEIHNSDGDALDLQEVLERQKWTDLIEGAAHCDKIYHGIWRCWFGDMKNFKFGEIELELEWISLDQ